MHRRLTHLSLIFLLFSACSDEEATPGGEVWLSTGGDLNLRLDQGSGVRLEQLTFQLNLAGTWITARQLGPPTISEQADGSTLVRFGRGASDGPQQVDVTVRPPTSAGGAWRLAWAITAPQGTDLKLRALEVSVPAGGVILPGLSKDLYFLQDGYQSWSFTGAMKLEAPFKSPASTDEAKAFKAGMGDPTYELKGVGWWFGLMAPTPGGPFLAAGAASANLRRTAVLPGLPESGKAGLALRVGTAEEPVLIKGGATHTVEEIALAAGAKAHEVLAAYAGAVAAVSTPLRQEKVQDPTGWWSWNIFFEQVTEAQVLAHADLLKSKGLDKKGFNLVELDDGYETRWGDWELTKSTFPSGLAGLAKAVKAKGLDIGVWMAPFLVHEDSKLVKDHQGWFVKDKAGALLKHAQMGVAGNMHVLDPTQAGAAKHLKDLFGRLASAGYSLFKLDFLYAGALPGVRGVADTTGIQALRLGLDIMRKAAPKAHFNLCGMPFLPAVGRGHSVRFGTDIAFGGIKLGPVQIAHEARNVMLRGFFDEVIRNDPDQALLRAPLTLDEARVQATFVAMTGFYSSGDDLSKLSKERLEVLQNPHLLKIAKLARSAVALDPFSATGDVYISPIMDPGMGVNDARTAVPSLFYLDGEGQDAYLAVFNWTKSKVTAPVDLALVGAANAAVTELWTGKAHTQAGGKLSLDLAPFSVALLKLAPALP